MYVLVVEHLGVRSEMADNTSVSLLEQLGDVLYGGINPEIPGHGGEECAAFLSKATMVFETLLSTAMMLVVGTFAMLTYSMPKSFPVRDNFVIKRCLLVLLCLVFGIEVGFKICSKQVLYLLNPCHVITVAEIYLLASKPNFISLSTLRITVHYVYGAAVAMLFPDTLCRLFPGEVIVYWIQHMLIFFIVPPYLIYIWGPNSLEPFSEWAWACFAGIVFGVHNHYILQLVGLATHVNLNYILCPAYVDPFRGPYYRTVAVFHQAVCLLTLGKIYTLLVKLVFKFLPRYKPQLKQE